MRRQNRQALFSKKAGEIARSRFEPWQLCAKDPREGIFSLVNTAVNISEEIASEFQYMARKFLPVTCDLSETCMVYRIDSHIAGLMIGNKSMSAVLTETHDIDDLISGFPTMAVAVGTVFATDAQIQSMSAFDSSTIRVILDTREVIEIVDGVASTVFSPVRSTTTINAVADSITRIIPILEELDPDSITVTDQATRKPVTFTAISRKTVSGMFDVSLDFDGDGVIWYEDLAILRNIVGVDQGDMTPAEWARYADLDIDNDGIIGERDYASAAARVPSLAFGVYGAIRIDGRYNGIVSVTYDKPIQLPSSIVIDDSTGNFVTVYDSTSISDTYVRTAYDAKTGIWYGIETDRYTLRAFLITETGAPGSNVLLRSSLWDGAKLVDVDICNGYLFVLISDSSSAIVEIFDIHSENVESSIHTFPVAGLNAPTAICITRDGYMFISDNTGIKKCAMKRRLFFSDGDSTYLGERETVTDTAGLSVTVIPQPVFNSLDAFFYNLGLVRSPGLTNLEFLAVGMDMFINPRSLTRTGIAHGITHALGFVSQRVRETPFIIMKNEISFDYSITIDSGECTVTGTTIRSQHIDITIINGRILRVDRNELSASSFVLNAGFVDGDGNIQILDESILIPAGIISHPISVSRESDKDVLVAAGGFMNGLETETLITKMIIEDAGHPFTYRNAVVNRTRSSGARISVLPIVATRYSDNYPMINDSSEVEL